MTCCATQTWPCTRPSRPRPGRTRCTSHRCMRRHSSASRSAPTNSPRPGNGTGRPPRGAFAHRVTEGERRGDVILGGDQPANRHSLLPDDGHRGLDAPGRAPDGDSELLDDHFALRAAITAATADDRLDRGRLGLRRVQFGAPGDQRRHRRPARACRARLAGRCASARTYGRPCSAKRYLAGVTTPVSRCTARQGSPPRRGAARSWCPTWFVVWPETLGDDVTLRDLGAHQLRDLPAPEQPVPGLLAWPSVRFSAAANYRSDNAHQPARADDSLRGPTARVGRPGPVARKPAAGHPDRAGRNRQDPSCD